MRPATDCTCKNNIKSSDVKIGVALGIIVLVPTLIASCYFNGLLWVSPFKKVRYGALSFESKCLLSTVNSYFPTRKGYIHHSVGSLPKRSQ